MPAVAGETPHCKAAKHTCCTSTPRKQAAMVRAQWGARTTRGSTGARLSDALHVQLYASSASCQSAIRLLNAVRAQDEAGESLLTTVTVCSWVDEHATAIGAPAHGLAASEIEGRHQLCIYTRVGRWQTGRPPTH